MKEFDRLREIINTLRSPQGCPWDKKQTHDSLLPFLFEEAYEVGDAIQKGDRSHLKEELGDLLLQIMLHAKIAEESEDFNINDVVRLLNEKLVRRHPHVFAKEEAGSSDEVVKLWESIKAEEKEGLFFDSLLDKVPKHFPPLLKSMKLQKTAAQEGFDWPDITGVIKKLEEEIGELKEALLLNDKTEIEHELGDLFFSIVNLSRFVNVKADVAMIKANTRFYDRFNYIEKKVKEKQKEIKNCTLEELEEYWQEAKSHLKDTKNG